MGEGSKFGRREFLGGAMGVAAAAVGLDASSAGADARHRRYRALAPDGSAPSGALGLGPGGKLLKPDSLPHPHLPPGTDSLPQIDHVVVLMMENHSFDDHFGKLGRGDGLRVNGDGQPLDYNPAPKPEGGFILSFPMPNTATPLDSQIGQSWDTSHLCWDHGSNQGFARTCGPASMGHFTLEQLPFYYSLARR
ncbi:MAG: hypothetical protein JO368_09855, partial [Acidimicrobiales bacterium]|nr:hypothetical protein [Acidimicrobiales bacterium]